MRVSFIIPCYNMEKWIREAVESCLRQREIEPEVLVIDDGSADGSLEIVKSFGDRVRWETGPNRGVNASRNRALTLATGKYVCFLDADDRLEEDVIHHQAGLLEKTAADVCYGDWRHLIMKRGRAILAPVNQSGSQEDILRSLLDGWWCPPFAYLHRREFLLKNELYWNEHLGFPDDFEFIVRVALAGARFCYRPSLTGYYRMHPQPRLSCIPARNKVENTTKILDDASAEMERKGLMTEARRQAICRHYLSLAKRIFGQDRGFFRSLLARIDRLDPRFAPPKLYYRAGVRWIGYERMEWILEVVRRFKSFLRSLKRPLPED